CVDLCCVDALHAVGAFFHYPSAPHGYVRVAKAIEAGGHPIGIKPEIESPHFIGAVIRAVACADTAVVNHLVETFVIVERCADGTDEFAGGLLAMHARHGLKIRFRIFEAAAIVIVDPDPLHVASGHDFVFADDGDVIFRVARDHAGFATGAAAQVNGHAPGIA